MPTFTNYAIAAGHNNTGGYTKFGAIVPTSHIAFHEPIARPNYNPGIRHIRMDGRVYITGYPSQVWIIGFMSFIQYDYLLTTYCGGGYSGLVSVKTRYLSVDYDDYNATLTLPTSDSLQSTGIGYQAVPLTFSRLIAI